MMVAPPKFRRPSGKAAMTIPWDIPTETEIRWLLDEGLSDTALMMPTLIRAANVKFLDFGTFDFDIYDERAFVFMVQDAGVNVDLIAWEPARGALATWRGAAFALGQEAIFNPATYFDGGALRVHRNPLEWMRAERGGIVIIKPELAYAYLRNVPRLSFADPANAQEVKRWLQPPTPTVEILIEVQAERAPA